MTHTHTPYTLASLRTCSAPSTSAPSSLSARGNPARFKRGLLALACVALTACQTLPLPRDTQNGPRSTPPGQTALAVLGESRVNSPTTAPVNGTPHGLQGLPLPSSGLSAGEAAPSPSGGPLASIAQPGIDPTLLAAPDLWGRLRRGFALPPLEHELTHLHAQRFAKTNFLVQRADRMGLYLPLIVDELARRNMPLELAMLPLVESALNPHARSPVGATGTWQFMEPTARRFALRTSRLVDDRKNLMRATRAALDYLQKLHAQFGDWHLAMAAYNWGEGRVQSAVNRQRARGVVANFNTLAANMPAETRNYVPQIAALARLVVFPGIYNASLPDLPDGNLLVELDIAHDMDLALALRLSGLSEAAFLATNPAIKRPLILAAATPRLLLPEDAARRLGEALAAHQGRLANWSIFKLSATRHVEALAAAHGTSAAELRAANDIPRGMKPLAGSVLLLPVAPALGTRTDEATVAGAYLSTAPDVVQVVTRARKGETLADVARRCAVGVTALAEWNQIPTKRLRARLRSGQSLALWVQRERASAFIVTKPALVAVATARHAAKHRVLTPAKRPALAAAAAQSARRVSAGPRERQQLL